MPVLDITTSSNTPFDVVVENFQDPNYRHSLVESYIREGIAFQLKAMRAALTQGDVAEKLGNAKLQPIVSRYENPDYGRYSLATLLKLARIFDVALVVRFEPFSKFMRWHRESATESLAVPSFDMELQRGAFTTPVVNTTTQDQNFYRPQVLPTPTPKTDEVKAFMPDIAPAPHSQMNFLGGQYAN
ncbi:MAG TPA: helix-turn-helix transcriptional regulator [Terriglobales bacterium]|nr:helix-turn-helix transcriptional regulator [Terriglobales bacterium]